jgi:putative transposase
VPTAPCTGPWHLDEGQRKIKGTRHWLWRAGQAVDQDGLVLDILVQERRNQEAAERFEQWREAARLQPAA